MSNSIESDPALKTVTTKWAADYIDRARDTQVRTLLKNNDLSFRSERSKSGISDGLVSWWEMVRLDAYEHLKGTRTRDNRHLRDGLIILPIPLDPFVVVWSGRTLPVLIRPDQVIDYQMERGATGVYDPTKLLHALDLLHLVHRHDSAPTRSPGRQQQLFSTTDQLGLFGED